jgi:pimeloyl-ACP methyl ester carboxylesterase
MATFVLVHGAFQGGWIWRRVRRLLEAEGHNVFAPTLTGCGERSHLLSREITLKTHIKDILNVFHHEDLEGVVLVGGSYGGAVITGVAGQIPEKVARLVYLDGTIPEDRQAVSTGLTEGTSGVIDAMASDQGTDWLLPPLPPEAVGITAPEDIAWVEGKRHPHPIRTLNEPLDMPSPEAAKIPRCYILCARREGLIGAFGFDPLAPFVEKARRAGWPVLTVDAGHDAMVTAPREVARHLLDLLQ